MDQKIIPGVISQTTAAARQTTADGGKAAGKGIFARLLAIMEGGARGENGADSGKPIAPSAHAEAASRAAARAGSIVADLSGTEKAEEPVVRKVKKGEQESPDMVAADVGIKTANSKLHRVGLPAAGKQADPETPAAATTDRKKGAAIPMATLQQPAEAEPEAATASLAANAKEAVAQRPVKTGTGTDAEHVVADASRAARGKAGTDENRPARSGPGSDAPAVPAADKKESAAGITAVAERPARAAAEAMHAAPANPDADAEPADMEKIAVRAAADSNRALPGRSEAVAASPAADREDTATGGKAAGHEPAAGKEHRAHSNGQRSAGIQTAMQQPAAAPIQSEKGLFIQPEAGAFSGLPEQHRLSANHDMKNRRIIPDRTSGAKVAPLQSGADRKPELPVGQQRPAARQAADSFAGNMRDWMVQAESSSRQGQQSFDSSGGQALQAGSPESASTWMRSLYQHAQPISGSGPWSVAAAMQQIGHAAAQGKFQLELTLTPEHLGKVQVFLDSDANKQIQIHLVVDQAASRQSIEQHLPALRQALADQGLNMDSFSMGSSGQEKENPQGRQGNRSPAGKVTAGMGHAGQEGRSTTTAESRLSIRI